jgi:hypothetical protein
MMIGLFVFPRPRLGAAPPPDAPAHPPPAPAPADWQTDLDDVFYGLVTERRTPRWWQVPEALRAGPRRQP